MALSSIQQQRLLYWARRLRDISNGAAPLSPEEVEALGKLIVACDEIVNPVRAAPPGMFDKNGHTR